jgi:hypothetical protein
MGMYDYDYSRAARDAADALAKIAIEFKRYNDAKEKAQRQEVSAIHFRSQGYG